MDFSQAGIPSWGSHNKDPTIAGYVPCWEMPIWPGTHPKRTTKHSRWLVRGNSLMRLLVGFREWFRVPQTAKSWGLGNLGFPKPQHPTPIVLGSRFPRRYDFSRSERRWRSAAGKGIMNPTPIEGGGSCEKRLLIVEPSKFYHFIKYDTYKQYIIVIVTVLLCIRDYNVILGHQSIREANYVRLWPLQ